MSLSLLPADGDYLGFDISYDYHECEIISDNNGNITNNDSKKGAEDLVLCELDGGGQEEEEEEVVGGGGGEERGDDITIRSDIFGDYEEAEEAKSPPTGEQVELVLGHDFGHEIGGEKNPPISSNVNELIADDNDATSWLGVGELKEDDPDPLTVILQNCHSHSDSDEDEDADSDIEVYQATKNQWKFEKRRVTRNWKWSWEKDPEKKGGSSAEGEDDDETLNSIIKTEAVNESGATPPSLSFQSPSLSSNLVKTEPVAESQTEIVQKVEVFKCPFCLDMFLEGEQLIEHLPLHTTFKQITDKEEKESLPNGNAGSEKREHAHSLNRPNRNRKRKRKCPFECRPCKLSFPDTFHLRRHMQIHEETDRPFKCSQCESFFTRSGSMRLHENQVHNRKPGNTTKPCNICKKSFPLSRFHEHMAYHNDERPVKCPLCPNRFRRKHHARSHMHLIHKVTASIKDFAEPFHPPQARFDELPAPPATEQINKVAIPPNSLLKNRRGSGNFKCRPCNLSFRDNYQRGQHMRIHLETDRPFKCLQCKSYFLTTSSVRLHENLVHNRRPGITMHPCNICGAATMSAWKLKEHLRSHSDERPFKCPRCDKRCRRKEHVRAHMMSMHQENISTSDLTEILQSQQQDNSDEVKSPKKVESSDRYRCFHCGLSFHGSKDQRKHNVIHVESEDRPWKCSRCPSFFRKSSNLRIHENRVHNRRPGDSKCPCTICSKVFTPRKLKVHMRSHNDEDDMPFTCPFCDQGFRRKEDVQAHMLSMHDEDISTSDLSAILQHQQRVSAASSSENGHPSNSHKEALAKTPPRILLEPAKEQTNDLPNENVKIEKGKPRNRIRRKGRKGGKHKCSECNLSFTESKQLNKHLRCHMETDDRPMKCSQCRSFFPNISSLRSHENRVHGRMVGDTKIPCNLCGMVLFPYKMVVHMRAHSGERPFKCPLCNLAYARKDNVKRHLLSAHDDEVSTSDVEDILERLEEKASHRKGDHHPSPHYQQQVLDKDPIDPTLETEDPDEDDQLSDDPPKSKEGKSFNGFGKEIKEGEISATKHKCTQCNLSYKDSGNLKKHMRCHVETDRPWKCSKCHSFFLILQNLRRHENAVHGRRVGQTMKSCNICGKLCSPAKLIVHMRYHNDERPFKCLLCDKWFRTKENVKSHMWKVHDEDISSSDLGEILKQQQRVSLRQGSNHHTHSQGNKLENLLGQIRPCKIIVTRCDHLIPFYTRKKASLNAAKKTERNCDTKKRIRFKFKNLKSSVKIIGKNIDRESLIKVHNTSRSTTFECTLCEKLFQHKCKALEHVVVHTNDRPYRCSICFKSFRWRENLSAHQRTHSGRKPFQCTICSKAFSKKASLLEHQRIHSGDRPFQCRYCPTSFRYTSNLRVHMKNVHRIFS